MWQFIVGILVGLSIYSIFPSQCMYVEGLLDNAWDWIKSKIKRKS